MQLVYDDEVRVRFDPPYMPSTERVSPEDRATYGAPDTVSHLTAMAIPFEVLKTPAGKYSITLTAGPEFFHNCDGEASGDGAFVGLAPEDIEALFPQIKYQLENRKSIREVLIQQYESATEVKSYRIRREPMGWNFDAHKSAALDTLTRLATKGTDPLQDDMKAIEDRAAQDADTVVSNLANERMLADMYHNSDKSKGLDKNSEFYKVIRQYAEDNFKRSKPQIDTILHKYREKDELASMIGAYHKAFEDHFYGQVTKSWKDLRPSHTINPLPAEQPMTPPAAPEMAPTAARRSL